MDEKTNIQSNGIFIVFEGIDGSGKSTQIRKLIGRLAAQGIKCYETREPTDAPIGSLIHQIMTGRVASVDNRAIASLFAADRVDHLLNPYDGICKKLENGISVVSDRYYFSSYAYHGVDIDMDWVIHTNRISSEILRPAVTIFLDLPVKRALERIQRERFHTELYEKEERLTKVRKKYFEAFDKLKCTENVAVIDADNNVENIADQVWEKVSPLFMK